MGELKFRDECGKCGARRVDRQIGLEETPDAWVQNLVRVFREVRRVLRDDGTLWVEIGDSYGGGASGGSVFENGRTDGRVGYEKDKPAGRTGHKPKDLVGQPWLLARALQQPYYTGRIRDERDRVWLAAIIDGEGSIGIHKRPAGQKAYSSFEKADGTTSEYVRTQDSFQPKLEISNTNVAIIERVIALTGEGNTKVKQEAGTHGRKQTIYRWTVTADKCRDLLAEVYPHLVAKQHEARLAHGCPSSGDKAAAAHEALKLLHGGSTTGIDFPAPGSMWEAGWYLRSEIIWAREPHPNPMPESVTDRPTKSHSTVFLLSKQPRYFYDADAIREPHQYDGRHKTTHEHEAPESHDNHNSYATRAGAERWPNPAGANARSVWQIPTQPTPFAHFATWPEALCRRMILAGTSERGCCPECGAPWVRDVERNGTAWRNNSGSGGNYAPDDRNDAGRANFSVTSRTLGWSPSCHCFNANVDEGPLRPVPCTVLDPFAGSATTNLVARNHGRHSIGIELNEQYLEIAAKRLQQLSLFGSAPPPERVSGHKGLTGGAYNPPGQSPHSNARDKT
jgi:DNA modification methylase